MAKPVATINNIPVYSDKEVMGIINTLVKFMDGSSADVASGQVVNKGPGYISIGGVPTEESKRKRINKVFTAKNLNIANLAANVRIEPHEGEIEITVTAPENMLNTIDMSQNGDNVTIEGPKSSGSGGINISGGNISIVGGVIRSGNISIGGNSINIGGSTRVSIGNSEPEIEINVKVPFKSNIEVSGIEGKVFVGDTEGNLRARIEGAGEVHAGKLKNLRVQVAGSGKVSAQSVIGNLKMSIAGSGKVEVSGGQVNDLEVNISGSGKVQVNAEAQTADLEISGSGRIYVQKVVSRPRRSISGSGEISIGNW